MHYLGSEENPTLLHFAARFGLEKLTWQLLECPGGEIACDMRNTNDMTPADLAEQAGHVKLAHQLRGYMVRNVPVTLPNLFLKTSIIPMSFLAANERVLEYVQLPQGYEREYQW